MDLAQTKKSEVNPRPEPQREKSAASTAAKQTRKNGEWKNPRWENKLLGESPRTRLSAKSKSGEAASNPAVNGIDHWGKTEIKSRFLSAGKASAAPIKKWLVVEDTSRGPFTRIDFYSRAY